jgi:hypothetical protein
VTDATRSFLACLEAHLDHLHPDTDAALPATGHVIIPAQPTPAGSPQKRQRTTSAMAGTPLLPTCGLGAGTAAKEDTS